MTKYGAKKKVIDGIKFDSTAEAQYYEHLLVKQRAGYITEIELQPVLNLHPGFDYYGKRRRKMDYRLDFRVKYHDGHEVYIDIKGMATPDAKMKRKLAEYLHQDKLIVWLCKNLKHGDKYGWIEYDELQKKRRAQKRKGRA